MIIVKMPKFGLGNQLFLYAYTRYLADRYHKKLFFYFPHKMQHDAGYAKCLGKYHLRIDKVLNRTELLILSGWQLSVYYVACVLYKIWNRSKNVHIALEHRYGHSLSRIGIVTNFDISHWESYFDECMSKRLLVMGYFQVPFYAEQLREHLKGELVPVTVKPKDVTFLKEVHDIDSVCVHIRRGDYLYSKIHYVCDAAYYQDAISKMEQLLQNPKFYIFTDDVKMVRKEMKFLEKSNVVFFNGYESDIDNDPCWELFFMSQCRNFIISNSSFSWWAQFLSSNHSKKVIAPAKWYSDNKMEGKLFQKGWEFLE